MNPPPIPSDIDRLVIVFPSWVGDSVMATPLLRATRGQLPKAEITGVLRPGIDELLAGLRWFDATAVVETKGIAGPARLARQIRRFRPQAVLLLPNSFATGLGARLSGASRRIGYARDGRGWLLTHKRSPDRAAIPTPLVEYYGQLADFALGCPVGDQRLELAVTDAEEAEAARLLRDVGDFVLLNPGANRADKRWPAERFAAVADALATDRDLQAVASGAPGEASLLDAVNDAAASPIVNFAKRGVTLGSLKGVIRRAALVITNDTGPRLIAAALGTPVVSLFGPTDPRWTTIECPHEQIVVADPFLPQELIADQHADRCSIKRIAIGDVLAAAQRLLDARRVSSVIRAR